MRKIGPDRLASMKTKADLLCETIKKTGVVDGSWDFGFRILK